MVSPTQRPHYAVEIWKRSFNLFLRLGLPATLIRHEKRGLFVIVWTENILQTELFENDGVMVILWYPWLSFPQRKIRNNRWLLRF